MNKTITIDYQEYMKIFDDRDNLNREKQELNKHIRILTDEINFLKNAGEDILVIYKNDDVKEYEIKVKEKQVLYNIVNSVNELINKNGDLKDINQELKSTLDKSFQLIEQLKDENQNQEKELKELKNRNILERIFKK